MILRACAVGLVLATPAAAQEAPTWDDVGALFADRCVMCHSGDYAPLGLRLDALDSALAGSENGPVLIAGQPEASPLIGRLRGTIQPQMPMDGPPFLDEAQIALVADWITAGMPAGTGGAPAATEPAPPRPAGEVWFDEVEGIFLQRCAKCHSDGSIMGAPPEGLRLSSLEVILQGNERAVIVPGQARLSLVWRHVAGVQEPRMPFDGPPFLSDEEVALIAAWIDGGARDGAGQPAPMPVGAEIRIEGRMSGPDAMEGVPLIVDGRTRIDDRPESGAWFELRGVIGADGSVIATRLRER